MSYTDKQRYVAKPDYLRKDFKNVQTRRINDFI